MKKIKVKEHPVINAYCLYVFHRYKEANDDGSLGHIKAKGIMVTEIQVMEDYRSELHEKCMKILSEYGFTNKQATMFLTKEVKKLINRKSEQLQDDECFCGLCRIKLKKNDWEEHTKIGVHKYIGEKVMDLRKLWYAIKLDIMKEKSKEIQKNG